VIVVVVAAAAGTPAGAIAALVVFATPAVADVHLSVLSEPLFLALWLLALWAMLAARDRLWLLALLGAAAVMVRLAGAAVPAALVCWTLGDERDRYRPQTRYRRAALVGALPAIALIAWVVRTALAVDRHGTPHVRVYGAWGGTLAQAGTTLASWLVPLAPGGLGQRIAAILVAAVLIAFVVSAARDASGTGARYHRTPDRITTLLAPAMLLGGWYIIVVVAARAFVGGGIPLDGRILSPLLVLAELVVVAAVAHWWRAYHTPMRVLIGVLAASWIGAAGIATARDAIDATTDGSDFASSEWRDSPLVAWVRAHGGGHPLWSNWPPALYFHAGRMARLLPDSDAARQGALPRFRAMLAARRGLLVGFDERSPDVIAPDSLAHLLGLQQVVRVSGGAVWAAAPAAAMMPVGASTAGSPPTALPAPGVSPPPP